MSVWGIPVQIYRSLTSGVRPSSLAPGQLFLNQPDGVLCWPDGANAVRSKSLLGNQGVTTVNFGAAPGATDASARIADANILATSYVTARIAAIATADHSIDEHWVEQIEVCAGAVVAGVGFTIFAKTLNMPLYGLYSVAWEWR